MRRYRCFIIVLALILLFMGCKAEPEPVLEVPDTPAPTVAPTAEPTAEPLPTPMITDQWYLDRIEQLKNHLYLYGNYQSMQEVEKKVASMYIDPNGKMVALTFDGRVYDPYTYQIMDLCEQYNARVTFFLDSVDYDECLPAIKRMLSLGCEVGNHSKTHPKFRSLSTDEMREELEYGNERMKTLLDYDYTLFRPPYGSYNDDVKAVCREMGLKIIMWLRSSHDTHSDYTADMIYERVMLEVDEENCRLDGATILCHTNSEKTVQAASRFIPDLLAQGYQLVTVSEMFMLSEDGFNPGGVYRYK